MSNSYDVTVAVREVSWNTYIATITDEDAQKFAGVNVADLDSDDIITLALESPNLEDKSSETADETLEHQLVAVYPEIPGLN